MRIAHLIVVMRGESLRFTDKMKKMLVFVLLGVFLVSLVSASMSPVDSRTDCDVNGKCRQSLNVRNVLNDKGQYESCESALKYSVIDNSLIIDYGKEQINITYEYETASSLSVSQMKEKVNFVVEKEGCNLHFFQKMTDNSVSLNKLKYKVPSGFYYVNESIRKGNLYMDFNEAVDKQNISVRYDSKTNEVIFEGAKINDLDPSTGFTSPASATQDSSVGFSGWSIPTRALSSDNLYSWFEEEWENSYYLKVYDFGFSIPDGATIDGINASIERKASGTYMEDSIVKMVKEGSIVGSNKAKTGVDWGTTEQVVYYGGASDLWGTTWTPANINNNYTGFVISVEVVDEVTRTAYIDHMTLDVYYTASSSDEIYPIFSNISDNSGTLIENGSVSINATITNTNGTAWIVFDSITYFMDKIGDFFYKVFSYSGADTYSYTINAYGNGTDENLNQTESLSYTIESTPKRWILALKDKVTSLDVFKVRNDGAFYQISPNGSAFMCQVNNSGSMECEAE